MLCQSSSTPSASVLAHLHGLSLCQARHCQQPLECCHHALLVTQSIAAHQQVEGSLQDDTKKHIKMKPPLSHASVQPSFQANTHEMQSQQVSMCTAISTQLRAPVVNWCSAATCSCLCSLHVLPAHHACVCMPQHQPAHNACGFIPKHQLLSTPLTWWSGAISNADSKVLAASAYCPSCTNARPMLVMRRAC